MDREALFLIRPVVPFHKAILLRMMRSTEEHGHPQGVTKADQGDREIAALGSAHPARVAIQGNRMGQAVRSQTSERALAARFPP